MYMAMLMQALARGNRSISRNVVLLILPEATLKPLLDS
jgi:hypothetical protein